MTPDNDALLLEEPYEPRLIRYDEAGHTEWVAEDVPTVVKDVRPGFALLLHYKTRQVIGFRLDNAHV